MPVPEPPPVSSLTGTSSLAKTTQYVPVPPPPPVSSLVGVSVGMVLIASNLAMESKESMDEDVFENEGLL